MLELKITAEPNDFDSEIKIKRALLADNAFSCLYDTMMKLRDITKYEDLDGKTHERFWKFREEIYDMLVDNEINLDKLWN